MAYKSPYGTDIKFTHTSPEYTKAVGDAKKFRDKKPMSKKSTYSDTDFKREMSGGGSFRDVNTNVARSKALKK